MGWFWNRDTPSDEESANPKKKDSFKHLAPEIRDFLEKEAPIKPSNADTRGSSSGDGPPTPNPTAAPPPPPPSSSSPYGTLPSYSSSKSTNETTFDPTKYSKYGSKYADIWAQYRPPEMVDAACRTPQQAVTDVYDSYRQRKSSIGKAAMENCAFEHAELHDCYAKAFWGKWGLGGCSSVHAKLDRCFMGQQDFLKALGYMNAAERGQEVEDRVQIKADKLYREQVRLEEEIVRQEKEKKLEKSRR